MKNDFANEESSRWKTQVATAVTFGVTDNNLVEGESLVDELFMMQEIDPKAQKGAYLLSKRVELLDEEAAARKVKNHWSQ